MISLDKKNKKSKFGCEISTKVYENEIRDLDKDVFLQ